MAIKEHQRGLGNWRAQHGGWRLVATLAVTEITSYGVLAYAFGVSLLPMEQELRWSRTAPTGAYVTAKVVFRPATIRSGVGWTTTAPAGDPSFRGSGWCRH
jgi:hypothetical protein